MKVSKCCQDHLEIEGDYFICKLCGKPCDTICSLLSEVDCHDDG